MVTSMSDKATPQSHIPSHNPARDTLILAQPRRSGKTTKLIQLAVELREQGYVPYIVSLNRGRIDHIRSVAEELGVRDKLFFPVTLEEYMSRPPGGWVTHWLLDDVDDMLRYLFRGATIAAMSLTQEAEEERP